MKVSNKKYKLNRKKNTKKIILIQGGSRESGPKKDDYLPVQDIIKNIKPGKIIGSGEEITDSSFIFLRKYYSIFSYFHIQKRQYEYLNEYFSKIILEIFKKFVSGNKQDDLDFYVYSLPNSNYSIGFRNIGTQEKSNKLTFDLHIKNKYLNYWHHVNKIIPTKYFDYYYDTVGLHCLGSDMNTVKEQYKNMLVSRYNDILEDEDKNWEQIGNILAEEWIKDLHIKSNNTDKNLMLIKNFLKSLEINNKCLFTRNKAEARKNKFNVRALKECGYDDKAIDEFDNNTSENMCLQIISYRDLLNFLMIINTNNNNLDILNKIIKIIFGKNSENNNSDIFKQLNMSLDIKQKKELRKEFVDLLAELKNQIFSMFYEKYNSLFKSLVNKIESKIFWSKRNLRKETVNVLTEMIKNLSDIQLVNIRNSLDNEKKEIDKGTHYSDPEKSKANQIVIIFTKLVKINLQFIRNRISIIIEQDNLLNNETNKYLLNETYILKLYLQKLEHILNSIIKKKEILTRGSKMSPTIYNSVGDEIDISSLLLDNIIVDTSNPSTSRVVQIFNSQAEELSGQELLPILGKFISNGHEVSNESEANIENLSRELVEYIYDEDYILDIRNTDKVGDETNKLDEETKKIRLLLFRINLCKILKLCEQKDLSTDTGINSYKETIIKSYKEYLQSVSGKEITIEIFNNLYTISYYLSTLNSLLKDISDPKLLEFENCYDILGVNQESTDKDIDKQYHEKLTNPGTQSYRNILAAYVILSNEQYRESYNKLLSKKEEK